MARLSSQEAYVMFLFFCRWSSFFICAPQHLARIDHIVVSVGLLSCIFYCGILEDRHHVFGMLACSTARAVNIVGPQ